MFFMQLFYFFSSDNDAKINQRKKIRISISNAIVQFVVSLIFICSKHELIYI